jgi:hypothetical protein
MSNKQKLPRDPAKTEKAKVDKLEKEKRIRIIQEWMLQDHITNDIVNKCVLSWGISDRQAMRYIADAKKGFSKATEKKLDQRMNYHIQRRNKLLRDLDPQYRKTPEGIRAQLKVLSDIAKLEQLYTLKIEVGTKDGKALQTEITHKVVFEDYAK